MWDEALFNPALGRAFDATTGAPVFLPTEDGLLVNPVMAAQAYKREIDRTNVLGTLTGSLRDHPGAPRTRRFRPAVHQAGRRRVHRHRTRGRSAAWDAPDATIRRNTNTNFTLSNFLDFDRTLRDATTTCRRPRSTRSRTSAPCSTRAAALALPFDNQLWYNLGTGNSPTLFGTYTKTSLQSYMGRVNYTFRDSYILSLTGRYDGSSVLAEGHKYAFFPAASIGWQIGDESFMDGVPAISDLKLRLSYGRVGNSAIGAYQTLGLLSRRDVREQQQPGDRLPAGQHPESRPASGRRPTSSTSVSTSACSTSASRARSKSIARTRTTCCCRARSRTRRATPACCRTSARRRTSATSSRSSTQNLNRWHGIDWTSDFIFSTNKNQIVALQSGLTADVGSGRWVGQPINVYFNYQYTGIWQIADSALARTCAAAGRVTIRVADINGDGRINARRPHVHRPALQLPALAGKPEQPRHASGASTSRPSPRRASDTRSTMRSRPRTATSRAGSTTSRRTTGRRRTRAAPSRGRALNGLGTYASARNYKEGSFVRIRDITLGYTLPASARQPSAAQRARVVRARAGSLHLHGLQGLGSGSGLQRGQRRQQRIADRSGRPGVQDRALRRRLGSDPYTQLNA